MGGNSRHGLPKRGELSPDSGLLGRLPPCYPLPMSRLDRKRQELENQVRAIQKQVRSCAGCGLCCTEAHNTAEVLTVEAERIADWLERQTAARRAEFERRLRQTVARYDLGAGRKEARLYTCSFLEADMRCALPIDVKPILCLAFNPVTPDACDQDALVFHHVHDEVLRENRRRGLSEARRPIPVAVLAEIARRRGPGTPPSEGARLPGAATPRPGPGSRGRGRPGRRPR